MSKGKIKAARNEGRSPKPVHPMFERPDRSLGALVPPSAALGRRRRSLRLVWNEAVPRSRTIGKGARKIFLEFSFDGAKEALYFAKAMAPEAHDIPGTKTSVSRRGAKARIEIETPDTPSMRAAAKSYLQWTSCAVEMQKIASGKERTKR